MAELKGKILAGKVLVQPSEAEETTASGIIIPDTAKEKPQHGTVVMVGRTHGDQSGRQGPLRKIRRSGINH